MAKKFLFIDTNLFLDAVESNAASKILKLLSKQLKQKNITLILPEVIQAEIITEYTHWQKEALTTINNNLSTKNILSIQDTTEKQGQKKKSGETAVEKIDSIIELDRSKLLKKLKRYYKSVFIEINKIFKDSNTELVSLTDQILLKGIKRCLLKKSPYTAKKTAENTHTKDVDCIAFESLISALPISKKGKGKHPKDTLIMCVSDKDYFSDKEKLHFDIITDFGKLEHKCYTNLENMFQAEFGVKIDFKDFSKDSLQEEVSLSSNTGMVEGPVQLSVEKNLTSSF